MWTTGPDVDNSAGQDRQTAELSVGWGRLGRGASARRATVSSRDDPRQGGGTGVVEGSVPGGRTEPARPKPDVHYCISSRHGLRYKPRTDARQLWPDRLRRPPTYAVSRD